MRCSWLGLLTAILACTPQAKPPAPPADTITVDSTVVDSTTPDSLVWPPDYRGDSTVSWVPTGPLRVALATARAPTTTGMLFGFSGYKPLDRFCSGFLNASNMTLAPQYMLAALRAADQCGYHFAPAMERAPSRTNGKWNGPFSLALFKIEAKAYSDALTEAQWAYYGPKIPYLYGMDDMGCAACNGGTAITQQTTADAYAYLQTLTMAKYIPMALRVHPEWMLRNGMTKADWSMPDGSPRVDRTISQWYGIFATWRPYPTQQQWYARQALAGPQVNVPAQSYTVAYGGCWRASAADGCPADKLQQYGLVANAFPGNCANIGWNWREDDFTREPWLSAIKAVAHDAANHPVACVTGNGTAHLDSIKGSPEITRDASRPTGRLVFTQAAFRGLVTLAPDTLLWLKSRAYVSNFHASDRLVYLFFKDNALIARHLLGNVSRDSTQAAGPGYDSTAVYQGCAQIWLNGDSTRATPVPAKCWTWSYKRPATATVDSVKRY